MNVLGSYTGEALHRPACRCSKEMGSDDQSRLKGCVNPRASLIPAPCNLSVGSLVLREYSVRMLVDMFLQRLGNCHTRNKSTLAIVTPILHPPFSSFQNPFLEVLFHLVREINFPNEMDVRSRTLSLCQQFSSMIIQDGKGICAQYDRLRRRAAAA